MFGEVGVLVMNSKINNTQTKNSNQKNTSKYTEDWIDVKGIQNGMILLSGNEKVTGVKIFPRNIFILDPVGQEGILNAMRNIY